MSQPLPAFGPLTEQEYCFRAASSVDSEVKARLFMDKARVSDDYVAAEIEPTYVALGYYLTVVRVWRQKRPMADEARTIGRDIDPAPLNPAEQAETVDRLVDCAPGTVESMMGWLAVCRALFPNTRLSPEPA